MRHTARLFPTDRRRSCPIHGVGIFTTPKVRRVMALRLYEYPEAYRELWGRIEAEVEGLSDTDENPVAAGREEFDGLEGDYSAKVENIAKLIRSLTATHDALDCEAQRLKARVAVVKRKIEWLRDYVADSMLTLGHDKIEGDVLNVGLARNRRVEIDSEDDLPDEFKTVAQSVTVLKAEIRKALMDDRTVAGARLIETHSLRIR